MSTRTVRPATVADVVALVELRRLMFEAMEVPGTGRAAWQKAAGRWFREAVDRADVRVLVAEVDGEVVASAVAETRWTCPSPGTPTGAEARVHSVVTMPGARRRGHARALMEQLLAWCESRGVERVDLTAAPEARRLYDDLGFVDAGAPSLRLALPRHT